jgi:serine/threonine protein kinase
MHPDDVARLGAAIADALDYVHHEGVVHRDIKPANILLEPSSDPEMPFVPKLTDFGIAVTLDASRITLHGTTIGTPNYLSPEQAQGLAVHPASDVYSLGLVLIECLTGAKAFPGTGIETAIARLHHPPASLATMTPGWRELLSAMTALDQASRPSASSVASRLSHMVGTPTEVIPPPVAPATSAQPFATRVMTMPTPASRRSNRTPWIVAAALGAVAALAAVLAAMLTGSNIDTPTTPALTPTAAVSDSGPASPVISTQVQPTPSPTQASTDSAAKGQTKPGKGPKK